MDGLGYIYESIRSCFSRSAPQIILTMKMKIHIITLMSYKPIIIKHDSCIAHLKVVVL